MSQSPVYPNNRPSLDLWETQATHRRTVENGRTAARIVTQSFRSDALLNNKEWKGSASRGGTPWLGSTSNMASTPLIEGNDMVLQSLLELTYTPPANTSLIRVLGPVREDPRMRTWEQVEIEQFGRKCIALLDPQPPWFNTSFLPEANQDSARNRTNSTLFLLPLDPTVQYKLTVLPFNNVSVCLVSGFTTYPFHLCVSCLTSQPAYSVTTPFRTRMPTPITLRPTKLPRQMTRWERQMTRWPPMSR